MQGVCYTQLKEKNEAKGLLYISDSSVRLHHSLKQKNRYDRAASNSVNIFSDLLFSLNCRNSIIVF